ncbi:MAG: type II toxin-antitoxin system PemK/MazF family toxin [Isosphaeraceae bacterium]
MIRRGDVVIVDFPFTDLRISKVRPALVVQNDVDNARRRKTIVVLITGNLRMDGDPSHLLIDPTTQSGASSGLHGPSLVACNNLFTIEQSGILRTIGMLPTAIMVKIDACLKVALGLP